LLLVPLALSAVPGDSRLLEYSDNNPFYALSTALTAREDSGLLGFIDKISFHTAVSTTLDLLVWADSANSQSSLFSNFSLCQSPNLEKLPQTEFTFSHVGWTAGMECRSYSQDTGPTRSKRAERSPPIPPPGDRFFQQRRSRAARPSDDEIPSTGQLSLL
jgi:hypothetical protein